LTALIDTSVLVGSGAPEIEESWVVSVVSIGELQAGVLLATDPAGRARRLQRLTTVIAEAPVVPVDHAVAARYGELRSATGRQPVNDLWIAATALAHDFTLVTADERLASLPMVRSKLVPQA
jgi:predicted nucleic acid-binding protein